MHTITVNSYSEVKKFLGTNIQCIGCRKGCLAYANPTNALSPMVLLEKSLNSRKRRQK